MFSEGVRLQILERKDGLISIPHLPGKPTKPGEGAVKGIVLCVSLPLNHALHILRPDLLLEHHYLVG